MISGHAFPIAGRSSMPLNFTRPDSQETALRTAAAQPTRAAALFPATAAAGAGPEVRFKLTPGLKQASPSSLLSGAGTKPASFHSRCGNHFGAPAPIDPEYETTKNGE